ncbi:MAG: hypothetical protein IH991_24935 [Planctomycetes bacterium]|nr:hypothetical protein [Planctomycetota bacterium]
MTLSRLGKNNVYQWQSSSRPPAPQLNAVDVKLPPRKRLSLPMASFAWLGLLLIALVVLKVRSASARKLAIATILLLACAGVSSTFGHWETPDPFARVPQVSDTKAGAIFSSLHINTFRAFDYHKPGDIYEALKMSVAGELLNDLYQQIRRGLEMQEQGGAVSRIREVKILDGYKQPLPENDDADERGFQYRCRWTVNGTVEHWGHIHSRTNEYDGLFTIEPRNNKWKITKVDVLDERRVDFQIGLRGLEKTGG